jgi:hypothetical protein
MPAKTSGRRTHNHLRTESILRSLSAPASAQFDELKPITFIQFFTSVVYGFYFTSHGVGRNPIISKIQFLWEGEGDFSKIITYHNIYAYISHFTSFVS